MKSIECKYLKKTNAICSYLLILKQTIRNYGKVNTQTMNTSVFKKHREENKRQSLSEPIVSIKKKEIMQDTEILYCKHTHEWSGKVPVVKEDLFEWQNIELKNKPCDCGRVVYWEEKCGCQVPKWEIKWNENHNI